MWRAASWPDLAAWFNDLDQLTSTSKASASSATASLQALRSKLGLEEEPYLNFVEGFPGVACSDTDNPSRLSAWSKAGAESDRTFGYFGRMWTWVSSICLPWPGKAPDRYTGPFTHHTSNSVLVVGNRFDPATRYQGAVTLAKLLPDSRRLTLDGWGHTSLFSSACIDEHVSDYLLTGRVPPKGTVCPSDVVPFADSPTLLKSQTSATRSILIPAAIRRMISR